MCTSKRRKILILVFAIVLCVLVLFSGLSIKTKAYAEAEKYFSAEKYTESDFLLDSDGNLLGKNIKHFAVAVKAGQWKEYSLSQVIPLQYLESTETNAVFAYNGKEYGFYVVKEGERFDVLLIDFVFEFEDVDHSDLEYKICIEPILQQSFMRSVTSNGYTWKKYDGKTYKYYVSNPRFLTTLENENALNYGDEGYSKFTDDGLIIVQSRVNYGNVGYATESDLEFGKFKLGCNILLNAATDGVGGTIIGAIGEGLDIYNSRNEVTITTNSEFTIDTNKSKTAQRDDMNIDGYSRVSGFSPKEGFLPEGSFSPY